MAAKRTVRALTLLLPGAAAACPGAGAYGPHGRKPAVECRVQVEAAVRAGERWRRRIAPRLTAFLKPRDEGWRLGVRERRSAVDLTRITPPWDERANPRFARGAHLRAHREAEAEERPPPDVPGFERRLLIAPASVYPEVSSTWPYRTRANVEMARAFGEALIALRDVELTGAEPVRIERMRFELAVRWSAEAPDGARYPCPKPP